MLFHLLNILLAIFSNLLLFTFVSNNPTRLTLSALQKNLTSLCLLGAFSPPTFHQRILTIPWIRNGLASHIISFISWNTTIKFGPVENLKGIATCHLLYLLVLSPSCMSSWWCYPSRVWLFLYFLFHRKFLLPYTTLLNLLILLWIFRVWFINQLSFLCYLFFLHISFWTLLLPVFWFWMSILLVEFS